MREACDAIQFSQCTIPTGAHHQTMAIEKKKMWIGGTSGLARTYGNVFSCCDEWILLGHQTARPQWMPREAEYYTCDFTNTKPASATLLDKLVYVEQIVISIRPPLVSSMTNAEMSAGSWSKDCMSFSSHSSLKTTIFNLYCTFPLLLLLIICKLSTLLGLQKPTFLCIAMTWWHLTTFSNELVSKS